MLDHQSLRITPTLSGLQTPSKARTIVRAPMPQRTPPNLSVCMPTYRGAAQVRAAISSVLAQSLPDFESVLIHDNCPVEKVPIKPLYGHV